MPGWVVLSDPDELRAIAAHPDELREFRMLIRETMDGQRAYVADEHARQVLALVAGWRDGDTAHTSAVRVTKPRRGLPGANRKGVPRDTARELEDLVRRRLADKRSLSQQAIVDRFSGAITIQQVQQAEKLVDAGRSLLDDDEEYRAIRAIPADDDRVYWPKPE